MSSSLVTLFVFPNRSVWVAAKAFRFQYPSNVLLMLVLGRSDRFAKFVISVRSGAPRSQQNHDRALLALASPCGVKPPLTSDDQIINMKHERVQLAAKIDWG